MKINKFENLPFSRVVGDRIKKKRKELGLTQTQVAKQLGVTFQQIQKYEGGTNQVSFYRIIQLCNVLDVDIMYFKQNLEEDIKELNSHIASTYVSNITNERNTDVEHN